MHDTELERIVNAVVAELRRAAPEPASRAASRPQPLSAAPSVDSGASLSDIATREYKQRCGVQNPCKAEILGELLKTTEARIAVGKRGVRPPLTAYLRFLADHARSKGTVFKEVPQEWLDMQATRRRLGMTVQPLSQLIKAPQERRKRERAAVGGVATDRETQGFVRQFTE